MTFRVRFEDGVQIQYHTLPEEAQDALRARVGELREKPPWDWDNVRLRPPWNNPNSLETIFGAGKGILGFRLEKDAERIVIFDILWRG